jgi:hypothetical protein
MMNCLGCLRKSETERHKEAREHMSEDNHYADLLIDLLLKKKLLRQKTDPCLLCEKRQVVEGSALCKECRTWLLLLLKQEFGRQNGTNPFMNIKHKTHKP